MTAVRAKHSLLCNRVMAPEGEKFVALHLGPQIPPFPTASSSHGFSRLGLDVVPVLGEQFSRATQMPDLERLITESHVSRVLSGLRTRAQDRFVFGLLVRQ